MKWNEDNGLEYDGEVNKWVSAFVKEVDMVQKALVSEITAADKKEMIEEIEEKMGTEKAKTNGRKKKGDIPNLQGKLFARCAARAQADTLDVTISQEVASKT